MLKDCIYIIHGGVLKRREPTFLIRRRDGNYNCIGKSGYLYGIVKKEQKEKEILIYDNEGIFLHCYKQGEFEQMIE